MFFLPMCFQLFQWKSSIFFVRLFQAQLLKVFLRLQLLMQLPVAHLGILHQEGLEASWAGKTWEPMELEIKDEVFHDFFHLWF